MSSYYLENSFDLADTLKGSWDPFLEVWGASYKMPNCYDGQRILGSRQFAFHSLGQGD